MAIRNTQTILQALTKPNRVHNTQTVMMVLRSLNPPVVTEPPVPPPPDAIPFVEPALQGPSEGLTHLTGRVQRLIQDTTQACFTEAQVRRQVVAEIGRLARQELFGAVIWIQSVRYKSTYILEEHGLYIASSIAKGTPASPASFTTLADSSATFATWGVAVGDIARNLSTGAVGRVTTVNETSLVCSEGFRSRALGRDPVEVEDGNTFVIERPLQPQQIVSIRAVLYGGKPMHFYDVQQFQRLRVNRNHQAGLPRAWSIDAQELPNQMWVYPPPAVTGTANLVAPMAPLALPFEHNFVVYVYINPCPQSVHQLSYYDHGYQTTLEGDPLTLTMLPRTFYHPIVYRAASALLGNEGLCQNLPLAQALADLAGIYLEQLGVPDAT